MDRKRKRDLRECGSDNARSFPQPNDTPPKKKMKRLANSGWCFIGTLPPETLTHVFGFLEMEDKASVARVCKQWRDAVDHPSLWRDVHAHLRLKRLDSVNFDNLQTRGVRQVSLLECGRPRKLQHLVTTSSHVRTLSLVKCGLTNKQLMSIFKDISLPNLQRLHLRCRRLKGWCMNFVLKSVNNVQHLELQARCHGEFFSILSLLEKVQHLTIGWEGMTLTNAPEVPVPKPCMKELDLRGVKVDNSVLSYLKQGFPNLEKLDVGLLDTVHQGGIQQIAEMTQLKRLHVHASVFPSTWMDCLRDGLTKLQVLELDAFEVPFHSLRTVIEIPTLEEFRLRTFSLSEKKYRWLLGFCCNLTKFSLTLIHSHSWGPWVLALPLRVLPRLEEVCLSLKMRLTDTHIQKLCQALPSLTKLELKHNCSLTDDSLKHVAQVHTLRSLVLKENGNFSSKGLKYLREGCPQLQALSLWGLGNVKNCSIRELRGLESLERLQVFHCNVSDGGLIGCVMGLPRLQILEAEMSQESKRKLRMMKPGLKVRSVIDPSQ